MVVFSSGCDRLARSRVPGIVADGLARTSAADRRLKIDVNTDAAVAQHVHQILGGDVAAGARRERATTEPADRRVHLPTPRSRRRRRSPAGLTVLWRAPSGRSPSTGRRRSINAVTRRGVVVPMVSAIASRSAPI